ncbi:MAG: UbiA family prenyltransferase, partial [Gemmatimonadaceae bacterium]
AHPARPLPAGTLAAGAARAVAWGAALAGVALASAARVELGVLSVLVVALMYAYSPTLKRLGLAGNVTVAVLASLPFVYGAWAAGNAGAGLPLLAVAAPLHLAREIAKDLDDAAADRGLRRTVPAAYGQRAARGAILAALALWMVALLPLAGARPRFALFMLPAIVAALVAARVSLGERRGAPALLKGAMLLSMLALVAAYA